MSWQVRAKCLRVSWFLNTAPFISIKLLEISSASNWFDLLFTATLNVIAVPPRANPR